MTVLKGWYSQNGWSTRITFFNYVDFDNTVIVKLFEGESDKILAVLRLKLKPKEMRIYSLDRVKRVKNRTGMILVESTGDLRCVGYLNNLNDSEKFIEYKLVRINGEGCC